MKKYYLKKSARKYVLLFWSPMILILGPLLIPFATAINHIANDNLGWFLAGIMAAMLFLNIPLTILNTFVTISDKGIRFKMYVRTVITKWENVAGVVKVTTLGIFKNQEGLLFTYGEIDEKPRNLIFPPMRLPKTFIPLSWFDENWRDSEITQQIKQYAPHLFK
jgi:hypothetical protein